MARSRESAVPQETDGALINAQASHSPHQHVSREVSGHQGFMFVEHVCVIWSQYGRFAGSDTEQARGMLGQVSVIFNNHK